MFMHLSKKKKSKERLIEPFKPNKTQAHMHTECTELGSGQRRRLRIRREVRMGAGTNTHTPASAGDLGHKRWQQVFVLGSLWVRRVDGWTDGQMDGGG